MTRPLAVLTAVACLALVSGPSRAGVDVGVSIGISQPGVYGRIDIGRYPQPRVVQVQPVWAAPPAPVTLWVPEGHRRHWARHCHSYQACGVPVVFVQDRWYRQHVMPRGEGKHRH